MTTHPRSSAWRCWQSNRRQGCVCVRTVRHLWVASEGCNLLVVCHSNAVFCSGDVQVSLRVAACGFFFIGVFLARWDVRGLPDFAIVSASACFITKFFSFATVIMGESMSGFRCNLQSVHSVSVLRLFLESLCVCAVLMVRG